MSGSHFYDVTQTGGGPNQVLSSGFKLSNLSQSVAKLPIKRINRNDLKVSSSRNEPNTKEFLPKLPTGVTKETTLEEIVAMKNEDSLLEVNKEDFLNS